MPMLCFNTVSSREHVLIALLKQNWRRSVAQPPATHVAERGESGGGNMLGAREFSAMNGCQFMLNCYHIYVCRCLPFSKIGNLKVRELTYS